MATILSIPLQAFVPTVAGFSIVWILFGASGSYLILNRFSVLSTIWSHPLFLAGYAWLATVLVIESLHSVVRYSDIIRTAQMLVAAVFVAVLCRDRKAMIRAMHCYVLVGIGLAVFLYLTSYGALSQVTAADFSEATQARNEVLGENALEANMNAMAFLTGQGVVVLLALLLGARGGLRRRFLLAAMMFCFVATFLPMSRSGVVIVIASCAVVLFASRKFGKIVLIGGLCLVGAILLVPDAIWSRMTFSTEAAAAGSRPEARAVIYMAVAKTAAEYVWTGVGAGNFWESWAGERGFIAGAHNIFFQVTINWGLMALVMTLLIVWLAYRCLPKSAQNDTLALCMIGIAMSLFLRSFTMHNFYAKEFALGFGLLVAASRWIWPHGTAKVSNQDRGIF